MSIGATPKTIGEAVIKLITVKPSFKIALKRSYDGLSWKQFYQNYRTKRLVRSQKFDLNAHVTEGSDLAASKFVLDYCNGKVQDQNKKWLTRVVELPKHFEDSFKLTAVVAKKAKLISEGIDNFAGLDHLESLDLSENPELDDFACDQLARQFRYSKTLKSISLSYNPHITINGLNILFRIPSIEIIEAVGTRASISEEIDLFTLAAQDERKCDVFVHQDGRQFLDDQLENLRLGKRDRAATNKT